MATNYDPSMAWKNANTKPASTVSQSAFQQALGPSLGMTKVPVSTPVTQQAFKQALGPSLGQTKVPTTSSGVSSVGLTADQYKQLQAISAQNQASYSAGVSSGTKTPQQERLDYENQYRIAPQTTTAFSTPTTTTSGGLSGAFNALKSLASSAYNSLTSPLQGSQSNQVANTFSAFQPPTTANSASSTPTLAPGTQTVQTSQNEPQVESKVEDQFRVKTNQSNNQSQDSASMKVNLEAMQAQETAGKQAQLQQLQAELAQKQAQLAAIQAGQQPEQTQPGVEGQPAQTFQYNPEGNSQISALSSQIRAMEEEIQKVQQDSPELQAATQALQAKIAEEAMIRANLNQGITNVQDQPVAMNFISGQSAALERQANAQLQSNAAMRIPLQQQLANEQAKKQTALDVVKTKYAGVEKERDRLEDIYKTNYQRANTVADNRTKYTEVSPGASLYNPITNSTVYTAPTAAKSTTTTSAKSTKPTTSDIEQGRIRLDASKNQGAEADGIYADPNLYLQMYNTWIANGQTQAEFLKQYPPAQFINPANTWLPSYLMPKKTGSSSSSRGAI